ncbi:hypothetical protein VCHENC02_3666B, partial [Vibrio harveyi]
THNLFPASSVVAIDCPFIVLLLIFSPPE